MIYFGSIDLLKKKTEKPFIGGNSGACENVSPPTFVERTVAKSWQQFSAIHNNRLLEKSRLIKLQ
jgi:hypothetical protein